MLHQFASAPKLSNIKKKRLKWKSPATVFSDEIVVTCHLWSGQRRIKALQKHLKMLHWVWFGRRVKTSKQTYAKIASFLTTHSFPLTLLLPFPSWTIVTFVLFLSHQMRSWERLQTVLLLDLVGGWCAGTYMCQLHITRLGYALLFLRVINLDQHWSPFVRLNNDFYAAVLHVVPALYRRQAHNSLISAQK